MFQTLGDVINDTTSILEGIQVDLNSLARVDMGDRIALNPRFPPVVQCLVCAITDTSCYTWINTLD